MLLGTFVLAFQNIVAKTVERRVPPMQVVFIRSIISGSVTVYTTYQYQRAHNRKVIAKRRARGVGGGEGAATAAGASCSMPADSAASRERPEDDDNVRARSPWRPSPAIVRCGISVRCAGWWVLRPSRWRT